jgi:hypothetical protein
MQGLFQKKYNRRKVDALGDIEWNFYNRGSPHDFCYVDIFMQ